MGPASDDDAKPWLGKRRLGKCDWSSLHHARSECLAELLKWAWPACANQYCRNAYQISQQMIEFLETLQATETDLEECSVFLCKIKRVMWLHVFGICLEAFHGGVLALH